jgi:hypothetical protein
MRYHRRLQRGRELLAEDRGTPAPTTATSITSAWVELADVAGQWDANKKQMRASAERVWTCQNPRCQKRFQTRDNTQQKYCSLECSRIS